MKYHIIYDAKNVSTQFFNKIEMKFKKLRGCAT